jgi:hypothetical protein
VDQEERVFTWLIKAMSTALANKCPEIIASNPNQTIKTGLARKAGCSRTFYRLSRQSIAFRGKGMGEGESWIPIFGAGPEYHTEPGQGRAN